MTNPLVTLDEAAELLRTPVSTLRYWRSTNTGPKSARIGRRVVYRRDDLDRWLDEQFEASR